MKCEPSFPRFSAAALIIISISALSTGLQESTVPDCTFKPQPSSVIQPSESLGFVRCFVPPTEAYKLTRDGEEVSLGWGVTVQSGDILEITTIAGQGVPPRLLVVDLGDVELAIDETHRRLQIPKAARPPGSTQTAFSHVTAFLSGFLPKPETPTHKPSIGFKIQGGGAAISIPLLEYKTGQLIAADRTAYLAWIGGTPPYILRIYRKDADEPTLTISGLKSTHAAFDESKLPLGNYHLVVEDAREVSSGGHLSVLTPEALPSLPAADADALSQGKASEALKSTLFASWLAQQQDGAWALEAYQRVANAPEDFSPAVLLRRRLEGGQ
jgi:hypothetical protein